MLNPTFIIKIPLTVFLCILSVSFAQHGITPSLNGAYFDDARFRSLEFKDTVTYGLENSSNLTTSYSGDNYYSRSESYGRQFGRYSSGSYSRSSMFSNPHIGHNGNGPANFKIGSIPFSLSAGITSEWNDNITRASQDELEDIILGARIGLSGVITPTAYNRINISIGAGWDWYLNHPEANPSDGRDFALNISDGSNISFDLLVGDVIITFYDRFSVSRLSTDDFALDDLDLFSSFQNDAGIATNWGINSTTYLTVGLNRQDIISIDDDFDQLDRVTHTGSVSFGWSPTHIWTAGINYTYSNYKYDGDVQNDGDTSQVGVFFASPITRNTSIRAGAGIQSFDSDLGGLNEDTNNNLDEVYYNISFNNQLNARVSQNLIFGHESSLGTRSNFVTTDYARYGLGIIGFQGSRISASVFWEDEEPSGGALSENYERYGLDLYWGYQFTQELHLGLGYSYGNTSSNLENRDYDYHSFTIDTSYPLTPSTSLGLGYRFWEASGENEGSNFRQNRVNLSLRTYF